MNENELTVMHRTPAMNTHCGTTPCICCDYCGAPGCSWQNHQQARTDVRAHQLDEQREEFPFGDHR